MWKTSRMTPASLLPSLLHCVHVARRSCSTNSTSPGDNESPDELHLDLQSELAKVMLESNVTASDSGIPSDASGSAARVSTTGKATSEIVKITKLVRPPAKFDLITNSFAYEWNTTAKYARKVVGPMREWASEIKYRTGVHLEVDVTFPAKLISGEYKVADDVELTVYLFGTDRGIANCKELMEAAVQQDPAYVRLGVFRRAAPSASSPSSGEVEWLMLRRINRDTRPPDIPKISLKLPGKYTLLYENYKEAAIRTLYEETGIQVAPASVFPSGYLFSSDPNYYWRPPVRYFVAEVPFDVVVEGPQFSKHSYMQGWDPRILRQSPDPIDREWARLANPQTGCAWMNSSLVDELQRPLRGPYYLATRYTPPPHSHLQDVVNLNGAPSPAGATPTAIAAGTSS